MSAEQCGLVGCAEPATVAELVRLTWYVEGTYPERPIAVCARCSERLREFDGEEHLEFYTPARFGRPVPLDDLEGRS